MGFTLYWLQGGGCGGDTWSLLNLESPSFVELLAMLDVEVLWHPSLSTLNAAEHRHLLEDLAGGSRPLDFLVVEGAVVRGPGGTGMFDTVERRPRKDIVAALARQARFVVAAGSCASFGGISGAADIEATGLQFERERKGGFLGAGFQAQSGLPVVNIPGCPCHPEALAGALTALATGAALELDDFNSPVDWFGLQVHQGCLRNEYHEYRVEDADFGQRGCLFFHLGCRGPLTHGPCNKLLWGRRSSKTRVGVPCVGCTRPDFPQVHPFFRTRNIAGIPLDLPEGVDRPHYMAYKGMAAAAAPERLLQRKTRI